MKLLTIIGARPQFIKAAPFSEQFRKKANEILIHTGQHYDQNMSDIFFEELNIPKPDYQLSIGSGNHGAQTGTMLTKIEEVILIENPDGILVYGDTNSTLAGALAASKLHIPVFHVEAGLRSYNKRMPEEQNRILTDHVSTLLLCPTDTAVENLKAEGIVNSVINTGDIMYDVVLRNIDLAEAKYNSETFISELSNENELFDLEVGEKFYLSTIHRAENTDDPNKIIEILMALENLNYKVILPIHPRTRKIINELAINLKNVLLINPVGYLMMLYLTKNAEMVITDSGGLQKEAYFLETPCTTLRDQTEWVETLENGWNILSAINQSEIIKHVNRDLDCYQHPQPKHFGDGNAAEKITKAILEWRA